RVAGAGVVDRAAPVLRRLRDDLVPAVEGVDVVRRLREQHDLLALGRDPGAAQDEAARVSDGDDAAAILAVEGGAGQAVLELLGLDPGSRLAQERVLVL